MVDLTQVLSGTWHLERHVDDYQNSNNFTMSGQAVFTPEDVWIKQTEMGDVSGESYSGNFHRVYFWELVSQIQAKLYFEDKRLFGKLSFEQGKAEFTHTCGLDVYQGWFEFKDFDHFFTSWRVEGPHKNLNIKTAYFSSVTQSRTPFK